MRSSFSWLLCPFDISGVDGLVDWLDTCFLLATARCTRLILFIFCLDPGLAISLGHPGSFHWRVSIGNQALVPQCACCYRDVFVSRSSRPAEQGSVCVYTDPYVYTQLERFLSVSPLNYTWFITLVSDSDPWPCGSFPRCSLPCL